MRIRRHLKFFLCRWGLYYPLDLARAIPDIARWLRSGCTGVAPHPVKMMVVMFYLKRFGSDGFVETGTSLGETLGYVSGTGVRCTSIELSAELHAYAAARFKTNDNVELLQGDSAQRLPEILERIDTPTLFWLDGHFSGGGTSHGTTSTAIVGELAAILNHPVKKHVILIDDARLFDGSYDYPKLDEMLRDVREEGHYDAEVSIDIIRLTPRALTT
jgi:hypothetical protein